MANRELAPWTGSPSLFFRRDPFALFRREMDRLFDDFLTPSETRSFMPRGDENPWPTLDVDETDQAYIVNAEIPGLDQKDIELNLRENVLTISGERREERREERGGRSYAERFYGQFRRTLPFQVEIDADKVDAKFKNGVLTVTLPKNPKAREKERRIEIK